MEVKGIPEKPLETGWCSDRPLHRVKAGKGAVSLAPTNRPLYLGLAFLVLGVAVYFLFQVVPISKGLRIAVPVFFAFASGGSLVGLLAIRKMVVRVRFDLAEGRISFEGPKMEDQPDLPLKHVAALQVTAGERKNRPSGPLGRGSDAFELNLAYKKNNKVKRINLLCVSKGRAVISMAEKLSKATRIPLILTQSAIEKE